MKKQAFSSEQYLNQRDHILGALINLTAGKLYLEFGKMLRKISTPLVSFPGYEPRDQNQKLLQNWKSRLRIVIAINASNIRHSKARGDLGISYDQRFFKSDWYSMNTGILLAQWSSHSTLANQRKIPFTI